MVLNSSIEDMMLAIALSLIPLNILFSSSVGFLPIIKGQIFSSVWENKVKPTRTKMLDRMPLNESKDPSPEDEGAACFGL